MLLTCYRISSRWCY